MAWVRHDEAPTSIPEMIASPEKSAVTLCWRERERDRFVGCHYTRKKTPMRDSRRTYAANPSTETGRNSKKGTNVLTEIYKFSATLHPYLRRPSFLTDTVQMLPLVNSSFSYPAHIISQRQVQAEHGSIDCARCYHHEPSSLICSEQRMSPSSFSKLHHTQITRS